MATPENDGIQQQDEWESLIATTDVDKLEGSKSGSGTCVYMHVVKFGVCFNIHDQLLRYDSVYTDTQEVGIN